MVGYIIFENILRKFRFRNISRVLSIYTILASIFLIIFYQSTLIEVVPQIFGKEHDLKWEDDSLANCFRTK